MFHMFQDVPSDSGVSVSMNGSPAAMIVPLLFWLVFVAAGWKLFSKAGEPGWAVLVPIYNAITFCKIAGKPAWWFILLCIPVVNFFILIILNIEVAKRFGKGAGFGIGMTFLGIIFVPMLAFGSAQYNRMATA